MKRARISIDFAQWQVFAAMCSPSDVPGAIEVGLRCVQGLAEDQISGHLRELPPGQSLDMNLRIVVSNMS